MYLAKFNVTPNRVGIVNINRTLRLFESLEGLIKWTHENGVYLSSLKVFKVEELENTDKDLEHVKVGEHVNVDVNLYE